MTIAQQVVAQALAEQRIVFEQQQSHGVEAGMETEVEAPNRSTSELQVGFMHAACNRVDASCSRPARTPSSAT